MIITVVTEVEKELIFEISGMNTRDCVILFTSNERNVEQKILKHIKEKYSFVY